ncbi:hypothetical protein [Kitasatospora kifunensis]|uniref:Uncharacterized protein n=1 Tax=Kitasatospora kifunensis TaxID=58351 RepID=A0A7W7QZ40_KITKI|nr:hypothetical protein [Kitasatospora kifunensis]MBB4922174.1 hypothetical protein [Kitasatospora kifunensis]
MTAGWMAALVLACAGVLALLAWDQQRVQAGRVEAERQGRPLTAAEEHEWAAITAPLIEEQRGRG